MTAAIEAHDLTKVFRTTKRQPGVRGIVRSLVAPHIVSKTAVADVCFTVPPGELVAMLGPNGAGKSTTIKMLTGILTPTSGLARVAGVIPYKQREVNARNIGAVFGQRTQLWWDLPAYESFRILRDIYGVSRSDHAARLAEFDRLLELSAFWDTRVRHLSLGQRVRCDLAAALLHNPPVVFLDEPTIGMDVVVKQQVRALLQHQVTEGGRTVLLTTHDMTEVERLADRVVLINHGRIVSDGSLADIRSRFGDGWRVAATVHDPAAVATILCPPGLRVLHSEGPRITLGPSEPDGPFSAHQAVRWVIERYEVDDIRIEESDLEDVMRAAYGSPEAAVA
jgi:ABC-2 type transport system ATP-binding protein